MVRIFQKTWLAYRRVVNIGLILAALATTVVYAGSSSF
jgi:hypothetical protein